MTPEEKSLLERTYKMTEENNAILRKMRRSAWIGNVMRGLYWLVIIFLSFGAYYFIQPYINSLTSALGETQGSNSSSLESLSGIRDLLK